MAFDADLARCLCPACGLRIPLTPAQAGELADALAGVIDLPVPAYLRMLAMGDATARLQLDYLAACGFSAAADAAYDAAQAVLRMEPSSSAAETVERAWWRMVQAGADRFAAFTTWHRAMVWGVRPGEGQVAA